MNNITIKGRLTETPELKVTPSGKNVVAVTVAVDNGWGEEKKADFFSVVAWEKTAEFISKYFTKGQEIIVLGEMHSRKFTDKNGLNRTVWELAARQVEFCGGKVQGGNADYKTAESRKTAPQTAEGARLKRKGRANIDNNINAEDFPPLDDSNLPF